MSVGPPLLQRKPPTLQSKGRRQTSFQTMQTLPKLATPEHHQHGSPTHETQH